jgi:hypothetical protein
LPPSAPEKKNKNSYQQYVKRGAQHELPYQNMPELIELNMINEYTLSSKIVHDKIHSGRAWHLRYRQIAGKKRGRNQLWSPALRRKE